MPSTTRLSVGLVALAVLLLATPLYAHAVLPVDEPRSSQLLAARELGEDFDGEPVNESGDLLSTWAEAYVLDLEEFREDADANRTSLLACTEAPGVAADVLDSALADGTASTDVEAVQSTLECLDDRYRYLLAQDGDAATYHEFSASRSDGATTVAVSPVDEATAAGAIRERELVRYEDLDADDQRTVDRVLDSEDSKYGGYQPARGSDVLEMVPLLVQKDGTTYVVELYGWVDGPDLQRLLVVGTLQALGVASLLGAGAVLWRRRGGAVDSGDGGSG